jgi:hypothetical protein
MMRSFSVQAYKVRLEIRRVGGDPVDTWRWRILEIIGPREYHGLVEIAVLYFGSSWDDWSGPAQTGIYDNSNPYQPVVKGYLPSSEFEFWYDVLRSEKPLTFFYNLLQEPPPYGGEAYIDSISLATSTVEPIGEGPVDQLKTPPDPFFRVTDGAAVRNP